MIHRIAHVVIYTNDLEKAIEFYTKKLGFKLDYQSGGYASLTLGEEKTRLGLHQTSSKINTGTYTEVSLLVDNAKQAQEELEKQGIRFTREAIEIAPSTWVANFTDPDGNPLSLYSRNG